MLYNFAKASLSRASLDERMEKVQNDLLKMLDKGGVNAVKAAAEWRHAAGALIREAVIAEFQMTDPTPIFTERRTGTQGDTVEFEKLVNTLRVVEYSPQSAPQVFTPRKAKWTIATSRYELAYGIPLQKVITRQHTVGEFAKMAGEALVRHYQNLTLTAIDTACANGNVDIRNRPLRTMAAGTSVAKAELDAALRRMYSYNTNVTIFGSRYALDAIYDFAAGVSEGLAEDLNARGVMGVYRGAKLVEMKDDYNEFYATWSKVNGVDPEKLIFIAAGIPGATLMEKDLSQFDWEDLDVVKAQWKSGVRFEHGILVHSAYRYHVIQLT